MTSLFTRLRSFFQDSDRYSGVNELYRLEAEHSRQIDLIEEAIVSNFTEQLEWKMGYFADRLQQESQLRNIITYMLVFKDLVSIGPQAAADIFLRYKLQLNCSEVLRLFSSYLTKTAFNRELYSECLQAYNNLQPQGSCLMAYKALNLLEELFNIIGLVLSLDHRELYHRLSICLVSDAVLYFVFVKQTILRHCNNQVACFGGEPHQEEVPDDDPEQLLSVVDQFVRITTEFRRVLFEFKIQNSYYRLEEQKTVNQLRKCLRAGSKTQKHIPVLTQRDSNKAGCRSSADFSFGACKTDRPTSDQ